MLFFEDVDFSFLDETESFESIIESLNSLQESIDYYNRIKFLLEDELVDSTKQDVNKQSGVNVQKILEWLRSKMQAIIDFAQNLYSNNRFEAIKLHIKNNVGDGAVIQVPEVLTTIPSQVSDLERYLANISKGVYESNYNFTLPDKTKMRNVNKAGLIQIVDDLQRAKTVFPKVTAAFNRARNAITQDNEKGNQVLNAMQETMNKIRTIFKDSAAMINSAVSNIQTAQAATEVAGANGVSADGKKPQQNQNQTSNKTKSEDVIFDNVFDYMILDENRNILVSESKEDFNLLGSKHSVYAICNSDYINEEQKNSFINLKNNRRCINFLNEHLEYTDEFEIKYILFEENGDITLMCNYDGEKLIINLDNNLNIL